VQGETSARLVHVSTEAVLADGKPIVQADETRPRTTRPIGPYPLSKGLAEDLVLAANGGGLATVIRRASDGCSPSRNRALIAP
jgi:nucleoside-diphosphate-sugar epimerase